MELTDDADDDDAEGFPHTSRNEMHQRAANDACPAPAAFQWWMF